MTKYLMSAALAAIVGAAAFSAPASAQSFSVNIGPDRPYYGHDHRDYRRGPAPGVRIHSGRSSYRDCYTKRTVKWVNGRKVIREREICD